MEHSVQQQQQRANPHPFFACYLLCSQNPRFKGRTYIGFTVNPRRRIRQHNGEIKCGAWRTKLNRPWEMVLCLYGFSTQVNALQFEWAWQHPVRSLAVREAASRLKPLRGLRGKIKLVYTMLTLPEWRNFDLTVNFMSTKYLQHTKDCLELPPQMKMIVAPIDELPCYRSLLPEFSEDENETREDECQSADEFVAVSKRSNLIATKKQARGFTLNKDVRGASSLSSKGRKVQSKDCQKKRYLKKLKCSIEDVTDPLAVSHGRLSPSESNMFAKDSSQERLKSSSEVKEHGSKEITKTGDIVLPASIFIVGTENCTIQITNHQSNATKNKTGSLEKAKEPAIERDSADY